MMIAVGEGCCKRRYLTGIWTENVNISCRFEGRMKWTFHSNLCKSYTAQKWISTTEQTIEKLIKLQLSKLVGSSVGRRHKSRKIHFYEVKMVAVKAFSPRTGFNLISEWQHTEKKALNDSFAIIKKSKLGRESKESPYHLSLLSFVEAALSPENEYKNLGDELQGKNIRLKKRPDYHSIMNLPTRIFSWEF